MRRVLGGGANNGVIHFDEKVWYNFIFFYQWEFIFNEIYLGVPVPFLG